MLRTTKTINLTGQSMITVDNVENVVVYMNATADQSGTSNISKNIQNKELYLSNKEQCRKDMNEFEDIALQLGKFSDNQESEAK